MNLYELSERGVLVPLVEGADLQEFARVLRAVAEPRVMEPNAVVYRRRRKQSTVLLGRAQRDHDNDS